ncbi:MAG: energy-coupling factor ABC transporter permease [Bacillota bacterium]
MSHLHVPDGLLSPAWAIGGFAITGVLLAVALRMVGVQGGRGSMAWIAGASAFMLLAMSVPIPLAPIPVHLNLMAMTGILLGVWRGVIAAFVTNLLLALMGHGGITALGLNTLLTSSEVIVASLVFQTLRRRLAPGKAAGASAAIALSLSAALTAEVMSGAAAELVHGQSETTFSPLRFLALASPVFVLGILVESILTALVVSYLAKVRPGLVIPPAQER